MRGAQCSLAKLIPCLCREIGHKTKESEESKPKGVNKNILLAWEQSLLRRVIIWLCALPTLLLIFHWFICSICVLGCLLYVWRNRIKKHNKFNVHWSEKPLRCQWYPEPVHLVSLTQISDKENHQNRYPAKVGQNRSRSRAGRHPTKGEELGFQTDSRLSLLSLLSQYLQDRTQS